ncbi:MAG: PrsW family intramembrane metalloprotease [Bacilli bacterium]
MVNISFDFNLFNNYYFFYERLTVLLFSLIPTIGLILFVLYTDRKSKEPSKNIIICLLSGVLTIALAKYFEGLVMPYFSNNIVLTYVWAAIEEISKIVIFYLFIFDNKHYDDIYDGLVYMVLIALSFAGIENIMYAFSESTFNSGVSLAIMRDFTTIPLHVICGVVIGYFISIGNFAKDRKNKYFNFILAIIIPSFIHGTFNCLMSLLGNFNFNYNNFFQVFAIGTLPLLGIMVALFFIAIKFSLKCVKLNDDFINCNEYEEKYKYLMNQEEYEEKNRKKREKGETND